jgi:hypothetical protein
MPPDGTNLAEKWHIFLAILYINYNSKEITKRWQMRSGGLRLELRGSP